LLKRNKEVQDRKLPEPDILLKHDFRSHRKPACLVAYARRQAWMTSSDKIALQPSPDSTLDKQDQAVLTHRASADCTAKVRVDDIPCLEVTLAALAHGLVHSLEVYCEHSTNVADETLFRRFLCALKVNPNLTTLLLDAGGFGQQECGAARTVELLGCLHDQPALTTVTLAMNKLPADAFHWENLLEQIRCLSGRRIALKLQLGTQSLPVSARDFERLATSLSEGKSASLHSLTLQASNGAVHDDPHCSKLEKLARLPANRLVDLQLILHDMPCSTRPGEIVAGLIRRSSRLQRLVLAVDIDFNEVDRRIPQEENKPAGAAFEKCVRRPREQKPVQLDIGLDSVLEAMCDGNESLTDVSFATHHRVVRNKQVYIGPSSSQHRESLRIVARNCQTAASAWRDGALQGFAASWKLPPDLGRELSRYGKSMMAVHPGHLIVSKRAETVARTARHDALAKTLAARYRKAEVARLAFDMETCEHELRVAHQLGDDCVQHGLLRQQEVDEITEKAKDNAVAWMAKRHALNSRR
jgi:hypothetical protein